jgi:light-harvesting complex I chlorophyll a/b binding protein 1
MCTCIVMLPLLCIATAFAVEDQTPTDKVVESLVEQLNERTLTLSPKMSVEAMQKTLKMHGVPPSPLQKIALTQFAATRNPSLKAQVKEEFNRLDSTTQAALRDISREVIVRAEAEAAEKPGGWYGQAPSIDLKLENMPGMTAPFASGGKPWDPLKLAANIDQGQLYFYREAELKNGRLAMLAFLSIVLTDKVGFHPFYEGPDYVSAIQSHFVVEPYPRNFWVGLMVACGFAELFGLPNRAKMPGDQGYDPLGLKPKDAKDLLELQNKELNNGRLAMISMAGVYAQELVGYKVF